MTYFDWLVIRISPDYHQRDIYMKLLFALFSKEFRWVVKRDQNRAKDGLDLRSEFEQETDLCPDILGPCTCLEMFIAMAIRCENDLMYNYDPDLGDQTDRWFWTMMSNLGLLNYDDMDFDPDAVDDILERFMDRDYGPNLEYCPFPMRYFVPNFEKMELAYQLNYYIRENFYW